MIDRVDNLSSYSLDILQKLFKKSMVSFERTHILKSTDPEVDYLREKQKGVITEDHREKLFSWIFNVLVFVEFNTTYRFETLSKSHLTQRNWHDASLMPF